MKQIVYRCNNEEEVSKALSKTGFKDDYLEINRKYISSYPFLVGHREEDNVVFTEDHSRWHNTDWYSMVVDYTYKAIDVYKLFGMEKQDE